MPLPTLPTVTIDACLAYLPPRDRLYIDKARTADASEALYRSGNDIAAAAALLADRAATTHSRF